jgi:hypothetical protein
MTAVLAHRKRSYLLSGLHNRGRYPQVGWRRARGGKRLASGLESAPLAPGPRPAAGLHLRPRHRTEPVQAQPDSNSVFSSQRLSICAHTTEHPLHNLWVYLTLLLRARQIVFGDIFLFFLPLMYVKYSKNFIIFSLKSLQISDHL